MHCLRYVFYKLQEVTDALRGVDFAVVYENIPKEIGTRYSATTPRIYWKLYLYLKGQTRKDIKMLDVGCGKGRMLEFFSRCGISTVDGIEYSEELVGIARANMDVLGLKCKIFHGNAAEWDGYDSYNYFYLFNPFGKIIMEGFGKSLIASCHRKPRKITIIYFNPKEERTLIELGMKKEQDIVDQCSVFTYET